MNRVVIALAMCSSAAFGQTAVESAVMTSAGAAGTAAGSHGAGKGVSGVFKRANTALTRASQADTTEAAPKSRPASGRKQRHKEQGEQAGPAVAAPAEDVRTNVRPEELKIGMSRDEILAIAGKPALQVLQADKELLTFTLTSGGSIDVIVSDGKVTELQEIR
jgi:hypothetical protein